MLYTQIPYRHTRARTHSSIHQSLINWMKKQRHIDFPMTRTQGFKITVQAQLCECTCVYTACVWACACVCLCMHSGVYSICVCVIWDNHDSCPCLGYWNAGLYAVRCVSRPYNDPHKFLGLMPSVLSFVLSTSFYFES